MKKRKYKIAFWRNLKRNEAIVEAHSRIEAVAKLRDTISRDIHVIQTSEVRDGENIQIQE